MLIVFRVVGLWCKMVAVVFIWCYCAIIDSCDVCYGLLMVSVRLSCGFLSFIVGVLCFASWL